MDHTAQLRSIWKRLEDAKEEFTRLHNKHPKGRVQPIAHLVCLSEPHDRPSCHQVHEECARIIMADASQLDVVGVYCLAKSEITFDDLMEDYTWAVTYARTFDRPLRLVDDATL